MAHKDIDSSTGAPKAAAMATWGRAGLREVHEFAFHPYLTHTPSL